MSTQYPATDPPFTYIDATSVCELLDGALVDLSECVCVIPDGAWIPASDCQDADAAPDVAPLLDSPDDVLEEADVIGNSPPE